MTTTTRTTETQPRSFRSHFTRERDGYRCVTPTRGFLQYCWYSETEVLRAEPAEQRAQGEAERAAQALIRLLTAAEVDGRLQPDTRRVIGQERQHLQVACARFSAADLRERTAEARRVATMWGVLPE